ncbi:MAG: hypothetical protein ABSH38_09185 [Verrucomicrobiota bacterium]
MQPIGIQLLISRQQCTPKQVIAWPIGLALRYLHESLLIDSRKDKKWGVVMGENLRHFIIPMRQHASTLAGGLTGLLFLAGVGSAGAADDGKPHWATDLLTNAAQIRILSAAETSKCLPVCLLGVMMDKVTSDPDRIAIILQDQTAGIYVLTKPNAHSVLAHYHRGDLLEIRGVTDCGQFAPIVIVDSAQKLGTAPIPAAKPAKYQQIITGALDAQWVELKGVVRQCFNFDVVSNTQRIDIAVDGGNLVRTMLTTQPQEPIQVDAEVTVDAICLYQFNQKRQVLRPILLVPHGVPLVVEKPAPADPYAVPVRSLTSLLTFSPQNLYAYSHRMHVRGIVTYAQLGSFIWIRDENTGLRLQSSQKEELLPGDHIEALGFPASGSNIPKLEDAVFRKIGSAKPPNPIRLTNFAEAFNHEDDLIVIEGILSHSALGRCKSWPAVWDGGSLSVDGGVDVQ